MTAPQHTLLRQLPSVESVLQDKRIQAWTGRAPRRVIVDAARMAVDQTRGFIVNAKCGGADAETIRNTVLDAAEAAIRRETSAHYRKVINATGIILHTALGRAVLPRQALDQIHSELGGYSLLQASIETGERSRREGRIESLLTRLTGAEAATVVNNNAAATMITLNTVAAGKEVIVSRGQLVEIGGSFRLPDIMSASGVKMIEVGTTNKTHPRDYENAITENTAAILRVHPSNYKIVGFTSETPLPDLERIAHSHELVLIDDVGAGSLVDFARFGFEYEPTLPDSIAAGADIVTSSGDKLIGACQSGLIIGRQRIVESVRKNPLARALRVDKFTLAALEATLSLFLDEGTALKEAPTLRMILAPLETLAEAAERIAREINKAARGGQAAVIEGFSQVGSGSLPGQDIPTRLVAVRPRALKAQELARRLRAFEPPVFARIESETVLLDPRTVQPGEEETLVRAVAACIE